MPPFSGGAGDVQPGSPARPAALTSRSSPECWLRGPDRPAQRKIPRPRSLSAVWKYAAWLAVLDAFDGCAPVQLGSERDDRLDRRSDLAIGAVALHERFDLP